MQITNEAKEYLLKIIESQGKGSCIRFYIQGYGWGGPTIGMVLDEPKEEDVTKKINGLDVCYEKNLENWLAPLTLDLQKTMLGERLLFMGGNSC